MDAKELHDQHEIQTLLDAIRSGLRPNWGDPIQVGIIERALSLLAAVESSGDEIVRELTGFTPGPWETNEAEHDCPYQDVVIRDAKGRGICRIWFDDAPVPDYNAEQSANVRLIKSAPTLLARITQDAQEIAALKAELASVKAERDAMANDLKLLA